MTALVQGTLEIAHVGILLRIDPRVREQHGEAVDVELHGNRSPTAQSAVVADECKVNKGRKINRAWALPPDEVPCQRNQLDTDRF